MGTPTVSVTEPDACQSVPLESRDANKEMDVLKSNEDDRFLFLHSVNDVGALAAGEVWEDVDQRGFAILQELVRGPSLPGQGDG